MGYKRNLSLDYNVICHSRIFCGTNRHINHNSKNVHKIIYWRKLNTETPHAFREMLCQKKLIFGELHRKDLCVWFLPKCLFWIKVQIVVKYAHKIHLLKNLSSVLMQSILKIAEWAITEWMLYWNELDTVCLMYPYFNA